MREEFRRFFSNMPERAGYFLDCLSKMYTQPSTTISRFLSEGGIRGHPAKCGNCGERRRPSGLVVLLRSPWPSLFPRVPRCVLHPVPVARRVERTRVGGRFVLPCASPRPYGMKPPGVETPVNLAWVDGGVQVRNVLRSVLPMFLVVLAMPSPAGADVTVYVAGHAVEVPVPLQLLMFGLALLSVGGLMRKWRQKSRRGVSLERSSE
jgi:hypothetical protein